jgi:hypothetical protein
VKTILHAGIPNFCESAVNDTILCLQTFMFAATAASLGILVFYDS